MYGMLIQKKLLDIGGPRFSSAIAQSSFSTDHLFLLSEPRSVRRFMLPLQMDNGKTHSFIGWRIIYSNCLGPTKGGVRFHPATNENDLTTLAFRLLLKCAANGLPHGGASGGVAVDPKKLSLSEKERLARGYLNALMDEVGPDVDILSPDLGTDAGVMSWMSDQYNKNRRAYIPGAVNGKPPALGGILGRPTATARGAWTVLSAFYAERGISPTGLTFAIQGYGSAGGNLARILQQNGLRLVAASDSSGGLYSPVGLDAEALWKAKQQGHSFKDLQIGSGSPIANDEVLTVKADLIIPAATANQITKGVARNLKCSWVVEIANSPIASDAEDEVVARGIEIIPDIVANAGGITMSHFEWAQNRGGLSWTAEESSSRLDSKMSVTAANLLQVARKRKVSLAIASQFMALERLSSALHL